MRKVVQVASVGDRVYGVCDDGTAWQLDLNGQWHELPPIPDPPPEPAEPAEPTSGETTSTQ